MVFVFLFFRQAKKPNSFKSVNQLTIVSKCDHKASLSYIGPKFIPATRDLNLNVKRDGWANRNVGEG